MKINISSIANFLFITLLLFSVQFFSPNLTTDAELVAQLLNGGIIRDGSANVIARYLVIMIALFSSYCFFIRQRQNYQNLIKEAFPLFCLTSFLFVSCFWASDELNAAVKLTKHVLLFISVMFFARTISVADLENIFFKLCIIVISLAIISMFFDFSWSNLGFKSIHGHKNSAGMIFAVLLIYSLCMCKNGTLLKYLPIVFAFSVLVVLSQSKTSLVLVFYIFFVTRIFLKKISPLHLAIVVTIPFFIIFIIALIFSDAFISHGYNFTGRVMIWDFVILVTEKYLFTGYGFASFWNMGVDSVNYTQGGSYYEFIRNINQSHNSYLDIYVFSGLIGVFIFLWFLASFFKKLNRLNIKNERLDYFFLVMFCFSVTHSLMESTLFRGDNLIWVLFLFIYFTLIFRKKNEKSIISS